MADAKNRRRFNIEVTQKDIERAHRNDSYICVVSQAIARAIPDATRIETDSQAIRLTRNGQRFVYLTPYAVSGYVIAFDAGDPIQPFSFQLRDPAKVRTVHRTQRGQRSDSAARSARWRARQKAIADGQSADDPKVKAETRAAAKAAYTAAASSGSGPMATAQRGRKAPPRVFRRKQRSYGHRLLRINQQQPGAK